jgi:hypothetical protein
VVWRGVALGNSQRFSANRRFFSETNTPWARLWADWSALQPSSGALFDPGALARLDADIADARADGRRIMLTAWRFPQWANGTADTFRLPADLSPGSDWARFVDFLIGRYSGQIEALEPMNEPNLQLHPQEGVADAAARMMVSAQVVAAGRLGAPLLVAPATADVPGYDAFTTELLDRLDARGFVAGPRFAWSHHSYNDVEADTASRTARARSLLVGRWAGWPVGDAAAPGMLVTETGARVDVIASPGLSRSAVLQRHAELLDRYWNRMQFGAEGEGVAMVCQYLFVTATQYDSGLCEVNGTPRPAYRTWGRLPAFS